MKKTALLAAAAATAVAIDNGLGITPPMGWRSWNLYASHVDQSLLQSQMTGLVDRSMTVDGKPTSLADLGYTNIGLDDAWQACGTGANGDSFHNELGFPNINSTRFPDMLGMSNTANALGLTTGWYFNNCICRSSCSSDACYTGDVTALYLMGFDAVKLDGCGAEYDLDHWAMLMNATGRPFTIENCHWGQTVPNATHCPYNFYRTSGDVQANYGSIVANLQTVQQFAINGLSRPGCFAYPDMLEVGVFLGTGGLTLTESRSHFGAWAISSSPLTLSHDLTNATLRELIWPIIANPEVIAVNQAWSGHSGSVFLASNRSIILLRDGPVHPGTLAKIPYGHPEVPDLTIVAAWQVLYKPVSSTQTAVLVMNHDYNNNTISVPFASIPGSPCGKSGACKVRDLWARTDLGVFVESFNVTLASHDSTFVMLTPA